MGQSTDALLVYGIDLGDEWSEDGLENMLDEDIKAKIRQVEGFHDLEANISTYLKANGVEHGVEIVHHGSCDYSMKLLGIEVVCAYRGDVKHLDLAELAHMCFAENWAANVRLAANLLGIPEKDASWMMVSMWC
jgi:hypothetical protein